MTAAYLARRIFASLRAAVEAAQARSGRVPSEGAAMARKSPRRLNEQERAKRRRQDRERLQTAAEQLLTSEGWQRWVRVRSQAGLARLSISNQLLVALARPDATFVAGFSTWLRLGYAVRKGERAVAIIAPLPLKERDRMTDEETGGTMMLFKTVFVFDRAQVDPIEGRDQAPLGPPCEPLTGDSHAHLLAPIRVFAESLGFSVSFESIPGETGGWCDLNARRIVVDADAAANAQLRILIHETVHALGIGYAEYGRKRAEVIVDTATAIACTSVGLRVDGDSIPYIAGWGETGELDAVTAFARTIAELARQIEAALSPAHARATARAA
jgi:hypothetical protein